MRYNDYPIMNGHGADWWFVMLLFWIVFLIIAGMFIYRLFKGNNTLQQHRIDPLDIAKERYAKGEITKEEFEQIKKHLT